MVGIVYAYWHFGTVNLAQLEALVTAQPDLINATIDCFSIDDNTQIIESKNGRDSKSVQHNWARADSCNGCA